MSLSWSKCDEYNRAMSPYKVSHRPICSREAPTNVPRRSTFPLLFPLSHPMLAVIHPVFSAFCDLCTRRIEHENVTIERSITIER